MKKKFKYHYWISKIFMNTHNGFQDDEYQYQIPKILLNTGTTTLDYL